MSQQEAIKLFETQKVRTYWDNEKEEWYFSVVDVCNILSESSIVLRHDISCSERSYMRR